MPTKTRDPMDALEQLAILDDHPFLPRSLSFSSKSFSTIRAVAPALVVAQHSKLPEGHYTQTAYHCTEPSGLGITRGGTTKKQLAFFWGGSHNLDEASRGGGYCGERQGERERKRERRKMLKLYFLSENC